MGDYTKKRAVRHKAKEWTRMTLRLNDENVDFLDELGENLGISRNLLINKIIDCFRDIDSRGLKTIGSHMINSSLKRDSHKYQIPEGELQSKLNELKKKLI